MAAYGSINGFFTYQLIVALLKQSQDGLFFLWIKSVFAKSCAVTPRVSGVRGSKPRFKIAFRS